MSGLLSTPRVRWLIGPTFQYIALIWQCWSLCFRGTRSRGFPDWTVMPSLVLGGRGWPPSEGGFSPLGPEGPPPLGGLS